MWIHKTGKKHTSVLNTHRMCRSQVKVHSKLVSFLSFELSTFTLLRLNFCLFSYCNIKSEGILQKTPHRERDYWLRVLPVFGDAASAGGKPLQEESHRWDWQHPPPSHPPYWLLAVCWSPAVLPHSHAVHHRHPLQYNQNHSINQQCCYKTNFCLLVFY